MDAEKIKRLRDGMASKPDLLSAATYFRTIMDWEGSRKVLGKASSIRWDLCCRRGQRLSA